MVKFHPCSPAMNMMIPISWTIIRPDATLNLSPWTDAPAFRSFHPCEMRDFVSGRAPEKPESEMSSVTEQVKQQFGAVAEAYVNSSFHSSGPDLALMVDSAGFSGAESVLDLGCGPG